MCEMLKTANESVFSLNSESWRFCCQGKSMVKNLPVNAGDAGSIPGLGRSPAAENGNPFQYSFLEKPMDREAWPATVHGVKESDRS